MTIEPVETVVVLCSLGVGLSVLARGYWAVRGTTLMGPWVWAVGSLVAWAAAELAVGFSLVGSGIGESLEFAALGLSFCPVVAVLGAKRPQHAAWNCVVVSLWAIVALPAAENLFLHPGQRLSLGDARTWFLWILIALELINYLPTRFAIAALLLAAGQIVSLAPYLAVIHRPLFEGGPLVGLVLVVGALLAGWVAGQRDASTANELDRTWLDFRDAFGLLWGLRLQERINAVAQQSGWDVDLTWRGFRSQATGQVVKSFSPDVKTGLRTAMTGVLRRFGTQRYFVAE
jgi:hypothetical protein